MKIFQQINRFYIAMALVMVFLSVIVIIVLRGIFGAISTASQVDEELFTSSLPRIDNAKIDEALGVRMEREFTPLDF